MTGTAMIGTRPSHYRITGKLGAGGIGEVYRAEDTNFDRLVAIKVMQLVRGIQAPRPHRKEVSRQCTICVLPGGPSRTAVLELIEPTLPRSPRVVPGAHQQNKLGRRDPAARCALDTTT